MSEPGDIGKPSITDRKPSVRRIVPADRERTIPNNPDHDIFYNAFTAPEFRARVEVGMRRVIRNRAESGFSILTDGHEIVYSPLNLGGRHPENDYEHRFLGHRASTKITPKMSEEWFAAHNYSAAGYFVIGSFHFHPTSNPFSQEDITFYDSQLTSQDEPFKHRLDRYYGLFISQWQGQSLPSVKLFMFAGPPTDFYYQGEDFSELSLGKQEEVLERSGMKVVLVDLPIIDGQPDLTLLKSALE